MKPHLIRHITDEEYYSNTEFVSNSQLKALQKEIAGLPPLQVTAGMERGRMAHVALLEPDKADDTMRDMKVVKQWLANPLIVAMLSCTEKEVAFFDPAFQCEWNGFEFTVKVRGKVDAMNVVTNSLYDLKVMTKQPAKNQLAKTIDFFDYDQQAAYYLDITGAMQMVFLFGAGLFFTIKRGDEIYLRGKNKYRKALFDWWLLVG